MPEAVRTSSCEYLRDKKKPALMPAFSCLEAKKLQEARNGASGAISGCYSLEGQTLKYQGIVVILALSRHHRFDLI